MNSEQSVREVTRLTPSRAARWALFAVVSLATAFTVPSSAHAAQVTLDCPGPAPAGGQFVGEVFVDVGTTPLGAYGITLTYDPTGVTIASVAGGNTSEFADP